MPIGFDNDGVGREHGADARAAQVALDLFQCGAVGVRQARKRRRRGETNLLRGCDRVPSACRFLEEPGDSTLMIF